MESSNTKQEEEEQDVNEMILRNVRTPQTDFEVDAAQFAILVEDLLVKENCLKADDHILVEICIELYKTTAEKPTALELAYTHHLLCHAEAGRIIVIQAVCIAAIKWNSLELWSTAVKFFGDNGYISKVAHRWITLATAKFGFEKVKPVILAHLRTTSDTNNATHQDDFATVQWLSLMRNDLCHAIGQAAKDDYDSAMPLCINSSTTQYLQELALRIHENDAFMESPLKRSIISNLVKAALSKLDLKVTMQDGARSNKETSVISSTSSFLITCIRTESMNVTSVLLDELKQAHSADPKANVPSMVATRILIPALLVVDQQLAAQSITFGRLRCIKDIQELACADFMSGIAEIDLSSTSLEPLTELLNMDGGVDAFLTNIPIDPSKMSFDYSHHVLMFLRKGNWVSRITPNSSASEVLDQIVNSYAKNIQDMAKKYGAEQTVRPALGTLVYGWMQLQNYREGNALSVLVLATIPLELKDSLQTNLQRFVTPEVGEWILESDQLYVRKSAYLYRPWGLKQYRKKAWALLDRVAADEEGLKEALGDNYTIIIERLGPRTVAQRATPEDGWSDEAPPLKKRKPS
ncbi:hypothetical protein PHLGIDRAFT_15126 [Phlebiopsis gigantea 11061_1 CR5-6]|uniref:Uncharacterized protein n=1 Tax=Phlebiopsis gigantea (strain 11061_1 CR5-6) TaxID=745531 RepID=A0A0C3NI50_PHLG1|nr:hypothetical protein PHLGIDRAFT_15126 [Phlebiopsis gigantea 11061_1 CR5-6]